MLCLQRIPHLFCLDSTADLILTIKMQTTAHSSTIEGTEPGRPTTSLPGTQRSWSDDVRSYLVKIKKTMLENHGVYSQAHLRASGFRYTGNGDAARCNDCGLKVSGWTTTMIPFNIHAERKPDCSFVCSMKTCKSTSTPGSSIYLTRLTTASSEPENLSKRQKTEDTRPEPILNSLLETSMLQKVRGRTFSQWPHRTIPSSAQMIEAGFFCCNVDDRVICIYCNLICQQWTPNTDDPCEVHKTLSPNCIYVKSKLVRPAASSIIIVNENATAASAAGPHSPTSSILDPLRSHEIVCTAACNPSFAELPRRHASFADWPAENLPSVDDLVRAGFFYTGTKTIVTCFYCNGSLQNWRPNDNPIVEHTRWFPHCAYAKQLFRGDLYRKLEESQRAQLGELPLSFLSSFSMLTFNV